jgi:hypothetical protein
MSDMAETIRRVFQDPETHRADLGLRTPVAGCVPMLEGRSQAPPFRMEPVVAGVPPLAAATLVGVDFKWQAALHAEEGWTRWATGARVCVPDLFKAEKCARLEVPPLPRRPRVHGEAPASYSTRTRPGLEALARPGVFEAPCALAAPRCYRALEHAMALPVAFRSEDIPRLSKALWMRYTLKLVRETGENIRNLEVLGLYRIPTRGALQMNHQAATGRLLVTLGPDSQGAPRAPFILARRKDDASIVCCFVEDV